MSERCEGPRYSAPEISKAVEKLLSVPKGSDGVTATQTTFVSSITDTNGSAFPQLASRPLFEAIVESAPIGFAFLDSDFRVINVNSAFAEMLETTKQRLEGNTLADAFPKYWQWHGSLLQTVLRSQRPLMNQEVASAEFGLTARSSKWWGASCYPLKLGNSVVGLGLVLADINKRKQIETALRQSGQRFRGTFQSASVGMALVDTEGKLLKVNRAICLFLGYDEEELVGRDFVSFSHDDELNADIEQAQRLFRGEIDSYELEKKYVRKDGRVVWGHLSASVVRDDECNALYAVGQVRDINEQKLADDAIRKSEQRYRTLVESIPQLVWMMKSDGELDYVNGRAEEYFGHEQISATWPDWRAWVHPADLPATIERWLPALEAAVPCEVEFRLRRADGEFRWFLARTIPLRDETGGVIRWFGTCTDIEPQKQAQERLLAGERRFRAILEKSFDCVELANTNGEVRYVSANCAAMLNSTPEMKMPYSFFESMHPDDLSNVRSEWKQLLAESGSIAYFSHRRRTADGSYRWMEVRATNLLLDADVKAIVINSRDISRQKHLELAEHALRSERDLLLKRQQIHFDCMPIGLISLGADLRIVNWNPASEKIFGYSKQEALGQTLRSLDLVPCNPESAFVEGTSTANVSSCQILESQTKDRKTVTCEWYNTPIFDANGAFDGMFAMVVDTTERVRLEAQYHQAQKMEAIGTLAGGVAHDFNNLLTIINGYNELLLDECLDDTYARGLLLEVQAAADRAGKLTDQLLSFSRKQTICERPINASSVIRDMNSMLARMIGEDIEFLTDLRGDLPSVRVDKHRLEQVVMNLVANARDAMPSGGTLEISTRSLRLGNTASSKNESLPSGDYVRIRVSDTGPGIDSGTLLRIFEPFYTTKGVGHGTGLGLATVHGIVAQANGEVRVTSEIGKGTTFDVMLPAMKAASEEQIVTTAAVGGGDGETILLVEDEAPLRDIARQMLVQLGYRVLSAANGTEAIEVMHENLENVDLLLTDVVMPGINGGELCRCLLKLKPTLKVALMTGYSRDKVVEHGVSRTAAPVLKKPFSRSTLGEVVRAALNQSVEQ